jgi:hypothetical protein
MNIFFDVDFTLITWNYRLRPHVHEVFRRLQDDGHDVYLWSGVGKRWEVVEQFALQDLIVDCFEKPLWGHVARLPELGITVRPDFVVDDHDEPVLVFGGAVIQPPESPLDGDTEMLRIYESIQAFAALRTSPP